MTQPKEERFVLFEWPCDCGAELQVHGQFYVGFRVGRAFVTCPKCGKNHDLPTTPLRFFLHEGTVWNPVPLD